MRWILPIIMLAACARPEASAVPPPTPSERAVETAAESATPTPTASATPTPSPAPVLVAAGDIASCDGEGDSATAAIIEGLGEPMIATLGDNVYPSGTDATFAECYDPAWGAFLERTRPALGNHDMEADGGAAYHAYFGDDTGTPGEGYYSYDYGGWHLVVLNSNCDLVPCGENTAQHNWLLNDLVAADATCTLAYWHHPRFTSGPHGEFGAVAPFWEALSAADADLVLVGHDHLYERFAPQAPGGSAAENGIRQFTVGTGGKELYAAVQVAPNSEVIIDDSFGVLELTLHTDAYDWRFLTVDGDAADTGTAACH